MYFNFHYCEKFDSFGIKPIEKPIDLLGYEKCQKIENLIGEEFEVCIHWKSDKVDDLTIIHGFIESPSEFEAVTDIHFFLTIKN